MKECDKQKLQQITNIFACILVKVCLHVTFLPCSLLILIVNRITDRMDPSSILSVIHTVTIGKMLNFNGGHNGHRL